jgi:hypothetical protein
MSLHLFLESGPDLASRLDALLPAINSLLQKVDQMSQDLSQLKAAVAANTSIIGSAITLIQGFSAKLQDAINAGADPVELQSIVDELNSQDVALSAAILANTPGEPVEPGTAVVEPAAPEEPMADAPVGEGSAAPGDGAVEDPQA